MQLTVGTTFVPCDMAGAWQEEKECILQDMNREEGCQFWMVQTNSNSTLETSGMIVITAWAFLGSSLFGMCKLRRQDRT